MMTYNHVQIDDSGHIFWNDVLVRKSDLQYFMEEAGQLDPMPRIILQVSPKAHCEKIIELRKLMNSVPICRTSHMCGEGYGWRNRSNNGDLYGKPEL